METVNTIAAKTQRSPYWDNFKGFLIILVVMGHCMWAYRDSHIAGYLVKLIYIFHMPAFIFVSGYLSRIKKPFDFKGIWEFNQKTENMQIGQEKENGKTKPLIPFLE